MEFGTSGLARHDGRRRCEVGDAARDVRVVAGAAGTAVTVVIHGPHVIAVTREHVHERIFALAGHGEVVAGARRVGRAVHQEQHGQRRLARLGRPHALAPQVEPCAGFVGPVFAAPDRGIGGRCRAARLGADRLRLRRCGRYEPCAQAEARPPEDGAACDRLVRLVLVQGGLPLGFFRLGGDGWTGVCCSPKVDAIPTDKITRRNKAIGRVGALPAAPPSGRRAHLSQGRGPRALAAVLLGASHHRAERPGGGDGRAVGKARIENGRCNDDMHRYA